MSRGDKTYFVSQNAKEAKYCFLEGPFKSESKDELYYTYKKKNHGESIYCFLVVVMVAVINDSAMRTVE